MYLSYEEYQNMGGALDETTFNDYRFEAETKIDWYTFNRLQKDEVIPEAVKRCVFRLIKLIQDMNQASIMDGATSSDSGISAGISSQSNDGVSISYNTISARDMLEYSKTGIDMTIKQYLYGITNAAGKKLLYRGLYPDE